MANDKSKARTKGGLGPLWRGFRPAVPATVGAFALTFLFAAMMPMPWITSICWNLYLDTIHPIFLPPLGNGARLGVALLFAVGAALIALVVALALVKPAVKGNRAMNQRVAARARQAQNDGAETAPDDIAARVRRRRADIHPDDAMVAPISAERDLPAGGLGPVGASVTSDSIYSLEEEAPLDLGGDMMLDGDDAAMASPAFETAFETAAVPSGLAAGSNPADNSLDAMVARFEVGLGRRRQGGAPITATAPSAANEDSRHDHGAGVDLALEAALSTLQRMSKSAIG